MTTKTTMTNEYYETCENCKEEVRPVFKPSDNYIHAKLVCGCSEASVAFGNISISEEAVPEGWGE